MTKRLTLTLAILLCASGAWAGTATPRLCPNANPDQTGNNANCAVNPVLTFGLQKTSAASTALTVTVNNCQNALILDINGNPLCGGSGTLTLAASNSRVITGNGDFAITGGSCVDGTVLAAGQSCTITIVFTPTASAGTVENATLTVTDNGTTPSQIVSLTGTSATVTDLTACGTLSAGTNYRLTQSVSSTQSCMKGNGANIDLNLNGFTITYGTSHTTTCVFGIYGGDPADDAWFNTGCAGGNSASAAIVKNLTVHNGTITEGDCLNPDDVTGGSSTIGFGQGHGSSSSYFNLTFNICSSGAEAIFNQSNGGANSIHDNVVVSTVVTARKRSVFEGVFFNCSNGCSSDHAGTTNIYNNDGTGGVQGGITWFNDGVQMFGNYIAHGNPNASPGFTGGGSGSLNCETNANGYTNSAGTLPANAGTNCTNNFGISSGRTNALAYQNIISPGQGRGIFVEASFTGAALKYNIVTSAQEHPNNSEYAGCQIGGAHSLQFDTFSTAGTGSTSAVGNNITGISLDCPTSGLRVTDSESYNNISQGNTYTAKRSGGAPNNCDGSSLNVQQSCGFAATFDGPTGGVAQLFMSKNDIFIYDSGAFYFDVDSGTHRVLLFSPTIQKGSNVGTYNHFLITRRSEFGDVASAVIDPTYGTGVSFTDMDVPAQDANHKAVSFYEAWTQTGTCQNAITLAPITGCIFTLTDAYGHVYSCVTISSGVCAPIDTTDFGFPGQGLPPVARRDNNDTAANQVDTGYNPYTRTVTVPSGFNTVSPTSGLNFNATGSFTINLTPNTPPPSQSCPLCLLMQ